MYKLAGSRLVPQSKSILQSVKDAYKSRSALAGVGDTKNSVPRLSGSIEMVRGLRQAKVRPRRAATIRKLHDVLISARDKKAPQRVALAKCDLPRP